MANDKHFDIGPIVALLVLSPIALIAALLLGTLAIGRMFSIITNLAFIGLIIFFIALLYARDKLSAKSILQTGIIFGFLFWILQLVATFSGSLSPLCSLPFGIGTAICGGIGVVSIFTDLLGYLLGGIVIAAISGGLLAMFRR